MTTLVVTAWVWATFHCLLPIPADIAFEQVCMLLAGNTSRVLTFSNDTHHHLHNFPAVRLCPAQRTIETVSPDAMRHVLPDTRGHASEGPALTYSCVAEHCRYLFFGHWSGSPGRPGPCRARSCKLGLLCVCPLRLKQGWRVGHSSCW